MAVATSAFRLIGEGLEKGLRSNAGPPYSEAHFATFPEDLVKPCVLAGSKVGDTVLDPFAGSGTSLRVAIELGRQAIGIELNPEYCKLIESRCQTTAGML